MTENATGNRSRSTTALTRSKASTRIPLSELRTAFNTTEIWHGHPDPSPSKTLRQSLGRQDKGMTSACYDACAAEWPPLTTTEPVTATSQLREVRWEGCGLLLGWMRVLGGMQQRTREFPRRGRMPCQLIDVRDALFKTLAGRVVYGLRRLVERGDRGAHPAALSGCALPHQPHLTTGVVQRRDPSSRAGSSKKSAVQEYRGYGPSTLPDRPPPRDQLAAGEHCGHGTEDRFEETVTGQHEYGGVVRG